MMLSFLINLILSFLSWVVHVSLTASFLSSIHSTFLLSFAFLSSSFLFCLLPSPFFPISILSSPFLSLYPLPLSVHPPAQPNEISSCLYNQQQLILNLCLVLATQPIRGSSLSSSRMQLTPHSEIMRLEW